MIYIHTTFLLASALDVDGLEAVLQLPFQPRLALRVDERVVEGVLGVGLGLDVRVDPPVPQRQALFVCLFVCCIGVLGWEESATSVVLRPINCTGAGAGAGLAFRWMVTLAFSGRPFCSWISRAMDGPYMPAYDSPKM